MNIFGIDPYNGWGDPHFNADDILPGDHIRFSWYSKNSNTLHSIFITDVVGDDIYFTDANLAGTCKIRWDATPMKRSTIQALLNNYSEGGCGIYRAPNNAIVLGEHGVDSFAPEIKNIEAVSDSNHTGFTINFKATDDLGVAKVSAVVWGATQTFDEAKSKGQEFAGTYDPQTEMGSVRINIGQDEGNLMHLSEQYYAVIYVEDIRGNSAVNPDENTSGNELCIAPIELRTSYAGKYKANKDGKGRIWPNTWQEGTLWSETTNTFSYVQDQEIRVSGGYYNSEDRTLYYRVFLGDNHENMPVHIYVKSSDFDSLEKDSDSLWDRIRHLSDDEVVYADGAEGRLILGETKQTLYKPKTKNYPNPYFGDDQGEEEGQYTSTGSCGNDVNYYYYEDLGLLTIKGAGNMYNYYSYSSSKLAPWNEYKNSITTIYIYNGVTSIGNWAFSDCAELTSLTIPDSVTYIGVRAFSDCTGLTSITIPDSVTSIGNFAFSNCPGPTSIFIPDSVTSIGTASFEKCSGLESITVDHNNTVYHSANNCLIQTAGGNLICGCKNSVIPSDGSVKSIGMWAFSGCTWLTSITIPNGVTSIGTYAFYGCSRLTSVTIGSNVTSIGDYAFSSCTGLTSITIPDSVKNIGERAFEYCNGLTSITIPNGVTSIGSYAFYGCSRLTSIIIPNGITSIGDGAFGSCTGLTSIIIPDGVTSIGKYAFINCSGLTSITIPASVTSIGDSAFYGCSGLTNITVDKNNTVYHSAGNCLIETASNILILGSNNSVIPSDGSVTSIGDYAFSGCTGLTNITIPDGITSIGDYAFSGCTGLTSITIPDGVTSIGKYAFINCSGLTNITIPDGITSIGDSAFYGCSGLTSITIPDGVTNIGEYSFCDCIGLTSITIPDSVTSIGYRAFLGCRKLTNVTIGNRVISIGSEAFSFCPNLEDITILGSVTNIGDEAFKYSFIKNVYYSGSEGDRANISIEEGNENLTNATWHYNVTNADNHYGNAWISNNNFHWQECPCGYTKNTTFHSFDKGTVTKPANTNDIGIKVYKCTVCGYEKTETIPKLSVYDLPETDAIKGNSADNKKTYDYKSSVTFTANVPEGGSVQWYVNGQKAGTDSTLTVKDSASSYTVTVVVTDREGNQTMDEESVTIKSTFFDKLVWFFKHLFSPGAYDIKQ